jgi:hypothetical protein
MAAIVLVHPVHGAKVATSEQEVEYDSLSGWTRYSTATETPAVVIDNALAPVKRRGRPPKSASE